MRILTAIIGYIKNVINVVVITKKLISQFKDMRRETVELKKCWKCGGEAYQWGGFRHDEYAGKVTCKRIGCMPFSENYTVEEWQNHPRPGDAIGKASMFATINIKGFDAVRDRINQAAKECFREQPILYANYHYVDYSNKPKRKSWIEKIRDYDGLQRQYSRVVESHNNLNARCNSAEAMRDHYKTSLESWESLAITKTRELELMSKVADNWQNKLVEANRLIEDIHNENTILGKRLKFSVGHNHIEIVVGNPVTACYFHSEAVDSYFNEDFLAVSILHKNDTYDWKRGAVEALDNMVHNWIGSAYGDPTDYFNALFTAYPEIGIQPVVKPVKKTKKAK